MFELTLNAPAAVVEPVSDALVEDLGALSVSAEDADAQSEDEEALYGEPDQPPPAQAWRRTTLKALFADEAAARQAQTLLQEQATELAGFGIAPVPAEDWVRLTQSQFGPVEVTPQFWIVPSWHDAPRVATRVIRLDPGLAFGTGTHPTTRMCLRWIAQHTGAPWTSVLDYGCGSGILAIAAALHAASGVVGVDIDPAAVHATEQNAAANNVVLQAGRPDIAHGQRYGLVLANILATPLKLLAPVLAGHVASQGELLLSGILERQADELREVYAPWCQLQVADCDDGWVLMHGRPVATA